MEQAQAPGSVRLRCPDGHTSELPGGQVVITHTDVTLIGASFWCSECGARVDVPLPAITIALLAELEVPLSNDTLAAQHEPVSSSEHRRTLSARLLPQDSLISIRRADP